MKHLLLKNGSVASICIFLFAACAHRQIDLTPSPQTAANELFAADAAFSRASAGTDLVAGLTAMFAAEVVMPAASGRFAEGLWSVTEWLRSNPDNARSKLVWTPIGGGVSADGQHGFTYGLMTLNKPDQTNTMTTVAQKYLAYWVKQSAGWRVAVYRRTHAAEGAVSPERRAALLPQKMVAPDGDQISIAQIRANLSDTEAAFSSDAQIIGIGSAFMKYGSTDAIHLGGATVSGFLLGPEAISKVVAASAPPTGSHVQWGADKVIAASSGDLGVTIGIIHLNQQSTDGAKPVGFPFFTVWRRASANAPWRYVAE